MAFTGTLDTDRLILLQLSTSDLISISQTNTYFRKLCLDETLWMMRTKKEYGVNIWMAKPKEVSARTQYFNLHQIKSLEYAVEHGRVDILMKMHHEKIRFDVFVLMTAISSGHLNILEWICKEEPDIIRGNVLDIYYWTILEKQIWIFKWLLENFPVSTIHHSSFIEASMVLQHTDMTKLMKSIFDDQSDIVSVSVSLSSLTSNE